MVKKIKFLLFPFSFLYDIVTRLRNHLYTIEHRKSVQFDRLTIGVGNLRVGGTGKTPIAEYLLTQLVVHGFAASYLSRGYGRKTKGFYLLNEQDSILKVGDEALQVKQKFPNLPVAVCEQRAIGVPFLLAEHPEVNAIVLDDVFQHRSVKPHLTILLTACHDLFVHDSVLPMGMLREAREGAYRADVVIVTKCQSLNENQKNTIISEIRRYSHPKSPILFSSIVYAKKICVHGLPNLNANICLLSGLADNQHFYEHVQKENRIKKYYKFKDHHNFSEEEVKEIANFVKANDNIPLVTTEKDWQRLKHHISILEQKSISVWVIPITVTISQPQILWQKIVDAHSDI